MPTAPTPLPTIPPFPALADRATGTYNSKAYDWATGWKDDIAPAIEALADNVYNNAQEAAAAAAAADASEAAAAVSAAAAAASATSATSAAGTSGTSTTSLALAVGDISFTTQTGKLWTPGMSGVLARTSDADRRAIGYVRTYNSGTGAVVFAATQVFGSGGPFTDWTFAHQGAPGIDAELTMPQWAPSTNSAVTASRNGQLARPSATITLTPDSAAALGDGFSLLIAPTAGVTTVAGLGTVRAGEVAILVSNGSANALVMFSASSIVGAPVAAAGAATVEFTALEAGYIYEVEIADLYGSTNNVDLLMRVSTDNGASYLAADYAYVANWTTSGTSGAASNGVNSGASAIVLAGNTLGTTCPRVSNSATDVVSGTIRISNAASAAAYKTIDAKLTVRGTDSASGNNRLGLVNAAGQYTGAATAINAVQIYLSSGTITGAITLRRYPRN